MSLDVYLKLPEASQQGSGIFIREAGSVREITRAEWDEKFPGRIPVIAIPDESDGSVYQANITHNLSRMAREAGLEDVLWEPENNGITHAWQLINPLRSGLDWLTSNPVHFKQFNPSNGCGDYDGLVRFVAEYLAACERNPHATVHAWR